MCGCFCAIHHTWSTLGWKDKAFKGPYHCYYMSLSIVNFGHKHYINPTHFFQNSFIYQILCLFTFCPYSINVTESAWKCVTMSVKKCFYMLIFMLGRQHLKGTIFPAPLSLSFCNFWPNQHMYSLKGELPIPGNFHVAYSVSISCFNMNGSEWGLKMQSEIY